MSALVHLQEAKTHHQAKRFDAAERAYKSVLQLEPLNSEALYRLGQLAFERKDWPGAADYLGRALLHAPTDPRIHVLLAMTRTNQGDLVAALKCVERAVEVAPQFGDAHNHLGQVRQEQGNWDGAIQAYRRAVELQPKNPRFRNNLGYALRIQGQFSEAIVELKQAVALKPDYLLARNNLGDALWQDGQIVPAQATFQQTIRMAPEDCQAHISYGELMLAMSRPDKAAPLLESAVRLQPANVAARIQQAFAYTLGGREEQAREAYRAVLRLQPDKLTAMFALRLILPPVYRDRQHVLDTRASYERGLTELETIAAEYRGDPANVSGLNWGNFYLAYQGLDDTEAQRRYAGIIETLLRRVLPQHFTPLAAQPLTAGRRLRVGFASSFLRYCTAGLYFKSWVTKLDRQRFEIFFYNLSPQRDIIVKEVAAHADHTDHVPIVLAQMAERIKGDRLDVLIFPEVGMDYVGSLLPALRLAPVQCAGWGHPVTTGRSNVDYFISCAFMEPPDAQAHYTERLTLLDGIGTFYERPILRGERSRKDFALPEQRTLYLNPQSLHKIHPDHDQPMFDILQRDPKGDLVFFQAYEPEITERFRQRIESRLHAAGIAPDRLHFLPRMMHDDYRQLNRLCDVMLDTLHWSGGNTSLDAIAAGLPIVALPGRFMRGRQSQAMLRLLGLDQYIATDADDYVRIAVALANDPDARARASQQMHEHAGAIFEREEPIRQLENFLLSLHEP
jgi:protein O-GlcNAc transferase